MPKYCKVHPQNKLFNKNGCLWCVRAEAKPLKKVALKKSTKPINKVSAKRKVEKKVYDVERVIFLKERPDCELHIEGVCTKKATTIQHLAGRDGDLYLDKDNWAASCNPCNLWAAEHSKEAIELGAARSRHIKRQ